MCILCHDIRSKVLVEDKKGIELREIEKDCEISGERGGNRAG